MRKITVAITRTTIVEVLRTWIMPKVSHQDPNTWAVSAAADPELRFPTCGSPLSTLTPSETCVPLQETRVDASPVHKSEAPAGTYRLVSITSHQRPRCAATAAWSWTGGEHWLISVPIFQPR